MKKQEWNGEGPPSPAKQGGEMKSPAMMMMMMMIRLPLANVTASGCMPNQKSGFYGRIS